MLVARQLTLWRGSNCLFEDLSFEVAPGRGLIVRGANGSGKTTLLRVLCGLTRPEQGCVEWNGVDIERDRAAYGRALAWQGHATGLKPDLTARDNLEFSARWRRLPVNAWLSMAEPLGLSPLLGIPVRHLSAGQQRRVALACILMANLPLWILDEPVTNLDRDGRQWLARHIGAHLDSGGIVIAAGHDELQLDHTGIETLQMENTR